MGFATALHQISTIVKIRQRPASSPAYGNNNTDIIHFAFNKNVSHLKKKKKKKGQDDMTNLPEKSSPRQLPFPYKDSHPSDPGQ